jgi:hypothetical protein
VVETASKCELIAELNLRSATRAKAFAGTYSPCALVDKKAADAVQRGGRSFMEFRGLSGLSSAIEMCWKMRSDAARSGSMIPRSRRASS